MQTEGLGEESGTEYRRKSDIGTVGLRLLMNGELGGVVSRE